MVAGAPKKKSPISHHGCYVLDGTTSEFDWDGLKDLKENPYVINPKKGYVVTANNRQYPDNVDSDFGTVTISTGRAQRIDELI